MAGFVVFKGGDSLLKLIIRKKGIRIFKWFLGKLVGFRV